MFVFADVDSLWSESKKILSNDELLYDPELDDKDEEWVNEQIVGLYIYL